MGVGWSQVDGLGQIPLGPRSRIFEANQPLSALGQAVEDGSVLAGVRLHADVDVGNGGDDGRLWVELSIVINLANGIDHSISVSLGVQQPSFHPLASSA